MVLGVPVLKHIRVDLVGSPVEHVYAKGNNNT